MEIYNKKPHEFQKYILEADPDLVQKAREEHSRLEKERLEQIKVDELEGLENEHNLKNQTEFTIARSNSSCLLKDMKGFIYGGISSRFWLLRKHLNLVDDVKKMPFYTWECITLELETRDVYLVIKNEKTMNQFIKILCHFLNTVDGNRDSAAGIKKALIKQKLSPKAADHRVMMKTSLRFTVNKVR